MIGLGAAERAGDARRLLVAYDGSTAARAALGRAAELARQGDEVGVVNVMPEPGVSSRLAPPVEERRRQTALLEEAERLLSRRGIAARCFAAVGGEAAETLAVARDWGADLIVVGARRGPLLGTVGALSDRIARRAGCDVLVVHADAEVSRHAPRRGARSPAASVASSGSRPARSAAR